LTEHRDFIADYLFNRQIDTIKYIDYIVGFASKHYDYSGDCPVAERLSNRVLIIPSYHSLKITDIQRIAQFINEGWEGIKIHGGNASL
jgi:dTDP-4-amino-4,6-dideoxygalactose transaminase